jgi:membrane protein
MQAPDEAPGGSQAEEAAPARGTPGSMRPGRKAAGRLGVQPVRRAADWGKQKYAGSLAEYLWDRLNAVDFIGQGMHFAATLLLCFFPFLIVANALAGRSTTASLARHAGLNKQAAANVSHLFAPAATTSSAVTGTASAVFFVLGGIAAATALQQLYERIFDLDFRGVKDVGRRLIWLALLIGGALLGGWAGPALRHGGGPVLLGLAAVASVTAFWWLTLWVLLAGRISWRRLFPAACATGLFYVGLVVAFSFFFSGMVISEKKEYGPIGVIFALMSYLIAIGIVIILGAVAGLVWQERGLSFAAALRKLRRAS